MPPKLALFIGAVFVFLAFRSARKHSAPASKELFWPTLWYLVVATRPIGVWLELWGVSLSGGSDDPTEGSAIDRYFFLSLTLIGLRILSKRGFSWRQAVQQNRALFFLVLLMAVSICWSQYSFVSFKRFIKVVGSIVMACVVVSQTDPLEALLTILRRCLYIHLPISIICTRYFRDIGVSFDYSGESESWQGISTTKNVMGQVAMMGALYFFWEVRRNWRLLGWRSYHMIYLAMAIYLLKGSEKAISMTSVSVCIFALITFLTVQSLRARVPSARAFIWTMFGATAALILLVVVHSIVLFPADSALGQVITLLGRDITLTDRTYIWSDVYAAASRSPLLGVGFGGFWIGRLANIPWNANMTWVLGQAHSGYVDTYLQLGLVGSFLLVVLLFTTLPRLLASLSQEFNYASFRITLFLTILFVNITESTYLRGDHHLWFIFMVVLLDVPRRAQTLHPTEATPTNRTSDEPTSHSHPENNEDLHGLREPVADHVNHRVTDLPEISRTPLRPWGVCGASA
jgi:O-antigen ligase